MNTDQAYYPLNTGNTWIYDFSGQQMVIKVESCDDDRLFTVTNSLNPLLTLMKVTDGKYYSQMMGEGELQMILKEDLVQGDSWDVTFKANGIDCLYTYTVKEIISSKLVAGKEYQNVAMVELDSKIIMNGNVTSMNAFTQCYYAKGVGLILTTTSGVLGNTETPLQSFELH